MNLLTTIITLLYKKFIYKNYKILLDIKNK